MNKKPVKKDKWQVNIGEKFAYLEVISEPFYIGKRFEQHVMCKCFCGKIKKVMVCNLKSGKTKSCKCMTAKLIAEKTRIGTLAENGKKKCTNCRSYLNLDQFVTDNSRIDKLYHKCKSCQYGIRINGIYGIDNQKFEELFKLQNYKCACCNKTQEETKSKKKFCIDHNHLTGEFRGILCNACNRGIGLLQDTLDGVKNAVKYLEKLEK